MHRIMIAALTAVSLTATVEAQPEMKRALEGVKLPPHFGGSTLPKLEELATGHMPASPPDSRAGGRPVIKKGFVDDQKPAIPAPIAHSTPAPVTHPAADTDGKVKELQKALDDAIQEYQKELAQIEKDAKAGAEEIEKKAPKQPSAAEAVVGHSVKIENHELVVKVPTPVVKMVQREVSAHIPQVVGTAKQEIVFKTISVRMVPKVIGRYPEVSIHGTKWKDIITHVPETFEQEQRVTVYIPQVKMARHDWKVNVPEFSITYRDLKINYPSVTVKSIKKEGEKAEGRGEELSKEVQERAKKAADGFAKAKAEKVQKPHAALFEAIRAQLRAEKEKAIKELKAAEDAIEAGLKQMRDAKVPDSDANYKELVSQKDKLSTSKKDLEATFEKALADVSSAEKESLKQILDGK